MSFLRSLIGFLAATGLPWDPLKSHATIPDHGHTFGDIAIDSTSLVQLAESLGGGIYPGMGSGQNDTVSNQDSVAPGFPLQLFWVVPSNQVKQQGVKLSLQPSPYRNPNTSTSTGPGDAHGHGGDNISTLSISIGNEVQNHKHQVLNYQSSPGSDQGTTWQKFIMSDVSGGVSHNESVWLHTDNGITADIWTGADGGSGGDHVHSNTAHSHSPGTTANEATHTHPTTTGFSNGTSPDNIGVLVDGIDVTSQMGGPFNSAQSDLDITPYVAPGTGIHLVQLTTQTNVGRIYGWVRQKAIINNLGTLT